MFDMANKGRAAVGRRNGKHTCPDRQLGARNPSAKLSDDDVRAILASIAIGEVGTVIARRYGVTKHTVHCIKHGRSWAHLQ